MSGGAIKFGWLTLLSLFFLIGCAKPTGNAPADDKQTIRDTVVAFQAALKEPDADKLWTLLDSESQDDAERAAKAIQDAYAKASAEQKAKQEKALRLPGAELAKLTGRGFLKPTASTASMMKCPAARSTT